MEFKKNYGIELLRIVSMLMVVTHHALIHGNLLNSYDVLSGGGVAFSAIEGMCQVCVNVFVLITGYYLTDTKFSIIRNVNLWFRVFFFSIICIFCAIIIFKLNMGSLELLKALFPISSNEWWFITKYSVLILCAPFINNFVKRMDKKDLKIFIICLLICFCLIPTFLPWSRNIFGRGYEFTWMFSLFFIGAYLRDSKVAELKSSIAIVCYLILSIFAGLSRQIIGAVTHFLFGRMIGIDMLINYNNIVIATASVVLFVGFKNLCITSKIVKMISNIGKYTLGAYLVSDMALIREEFWKQFDFIANPKMAIVVIIGVLFIGCILDLFRTNIYKLLRINYIELKIANFIENKIIKLGELLK